MPFKQSVKNVIFTNIAKLHQILFGFASGAKIQCSLRNHLQKLLGLYEVELISYMRSWGKSSKVVFDIGAFEGIFSMAFARSAQCEQVVAFEADTDSYEVLMVNLRLNEKLFNKIKPVNRRIDNNYGLEKASLEFGFPDLLKIDVDGFEYEILSTSRDFLIKHHPRIIMQTHSFDLENQCSSLLVDLGYTFRIVKNGWYRKWIPEGRILPHNRWLVASVEPFA